MRFMGFVRQSICVLIALFIIVAPFRSAIVRADDDDEFEFTGTISALPNTTSFVGDWIVAGRTVHVTSTTIIDQSQQPLAVGTIVKVLGTLRTDGTVDATRIETEKTLRPPFFEFTGTVQSLPSTSNLLGDWVVNGRTVHVTSMTKIETEDGPITTGTVVVVKGFVRPDGSIDAVKIEPAETSTNEFVFLGAITNLPNTSGFVGDWTVDGRTVHVTSTTRIQQEEGLVAIGAVVEVRGILRGDGSVDATRIEVEESAGSFQNTPRIE